MKKIELSYTREDIERAFDLHYIKQFPIRSKLLLILGMVLLATSFVFFFIQQGAFPAMKWVFALMGVFYIGFYFYRKKTMVNLAMKNPTIKDMRRVELSDKGIKFSGEKGFSEQAWINFISLIEDEFSILVYLSKHNFFILPKRCFDQDALNLITSSIKKKNA